MNIHDPKEVIAFMVETTHDEFSIDIEAVGNLLHIYDRECEGFSISWKYPGYTSERVQQIADGYRIELLRVQKELNSLTDEP